MAIPADILQLSISERIQLVEDIWDTISAAAEEVELTEAQQRELDRRIELYHQNPEAGVSWQQLVNYDEKPINAVRRLRL